VLIYDLKIRNVNSADLDAIMQVEEKAWPAETRAPKDKFGERSRVF